MYHLLAILTVCIWGTTFVSTKILLNEGLSPVGIFFFRFLLAYAGICLLWPREKRFCRSGRDELLMLVAGVSGGSLYFYTENTALRYTEAGSVSVIVCLAPLLTALLAAAGRSSGRRIPVRLWAGSVFAFGGVVLMLGSGNGFTSYSQLRGGLLAFLAALLWAVYQTVVKPLSDRYSTLMLTRKVFGYGLLSSLFFRRGRCENGRLPDHMSRDTGSPCSLLEPAVSGTGSLIAVLRIMEQDCGKTGSGGFRQLYPSQPVDHVPFLLYFSSGTPDPFRAGRRRSGSCRSLYGGFTTTLFVNNL